MSGTRGGILCISLDLELYWGVRDKKTFREYEENLRGTRLAVRRMLDAFNQYGIHATWATVGLLFCSNRPDALAKLPSQLPAYDDQALSPYPSLLSGPLSRSWPYFAPDLIDALKKSRDQEIATHTFSHYYCLEAGQSRGDFLSDLHSAINVANSDGISLKSIVFPRNQVNNDYLKDLSNAGIQCYRGNQSHWAFEFGAGVHPSAHRAYRMLDGYVSITGHHCYPLPRPDSDTGLVNLPASHFLRPFTGKLKILERFRLERIKRAIRHASDNDKIIHLWWHPHNFGAHTDRNMAFLTKILECFKQCRDDNGMRTLSMNELAELSAKTYA